MFPTHFSLAEILVLAGTDGGMAPPAKWHRQPALGSLLGENVMRTQSTGVRLPARTFVQWLPHRPEPLKLVR